MRTALKTLFASLLLCLLASLASAQTLTNVTGTITDPNGLAYSNAQISFQLVGSGNYALTPCSNSQTNCVLGALSFPVTAGTNGSFSISLYANASIKCGATAPTCSSYTVTVSEPGIAPPAGTGPQAFTVTGITIAGASQSLSTTLSTAAPALSNITGGGGSLPCTASVGTVQFWTSGTAFNCDPNVYISPNASTDQLVVGSGNLTTFGELLLEGSGTAPGEAVFYNAGSTIATSVTVNPSASSAVGTVLPQISGTLPSYAATPVNGDCAKWDSSNGSKGLLADAGAACNTTAAVANPPFDKSATGLSNPTADSTFTQPAASVTGWTLAGTAPASVATTPGTNGSSLLNVTAPAGGATSNAAGVGGVGGSPAVTAGAGGAGTGTNASGGAGGTVTFTAGNGGASLGTAANSNGGSVTAVLGTAGTGGSGAVGKQGIFQVQGTLAGFWGCTQGSAPTTTNANIAANSIFHFCPAAVTAYSAAEPAAPAAGLIANANNGGNITQTFSGDTNHSTNQINKTAALSTLTLCAATSGTACGQAGEYHIHWVFWGSGTACTSVTAGSVTFLLTWTDNNGSTHSAVALEMMAQTGAATTAMQASFPFQTSLANESASGDYNIFTAGTVVQFATGYTACTTGTGTYNLAVTIEQVQ